MEDNVQKVFQAIEELWEQEVAFIQKLVRYPSTLSNELDSQIFMRNHLLKMGLKVDVFDIDISKICKLPGYTPTEWSYENRPQVVGVLESYSGAGRSLVLNGHVDVVPPGSLGYWTYDPWSGTIEGDRLYGRGAADMKGGLGALIFAVMAVQKAGIKLHGDVIIQSVTEEECGGNGTLACLARGYSGDGCLVPEPLPGLVVGTGGILWLSLTVRGKTGHPSTGYKFVNAIENALLIVQGLKQIEEKWNADLNNSYMGLEHPVNFVISSIKGGDWPSNPPDDCTVIARIGFPPEVAPEDAKKILEDALLEYTKQHHNLQKNPPETKWLPVNAAGVVMNKDDAFIKTLAAAHKKVRGSDAVLTYSAGSTDHRFWPLYYGLPSASYGPTGAGFHGHDEYVSLASVKDVTKVIAQFIMDWCGGGGSRR